MLLKKLNLFDLDLRSIALLRIGLAVLIITDLWIRFGDLEAHYTDIGVLPRSLVIPKLAEGFWSIYLLVDDPRVLTFLFCVNGLLAIALLVGWRSRWMALGCWLFLISLQYRNSMVHHGGDTTLRLILFWGMFLPLGARYSIDSALDTAKKLPNRLACTATFAYTFQICFIYWFASLWKANSVWWEEQNGVYYALNLDFFATNFAHWLLNFPFLLPALNLGTLLIELLVPFLLFIPARSHKWVWRLAAVMIFISLHLGFRLALNIGLFAGISAVSWLAFIPSEVWDRWGERLSTEQRKNVKVFYDRECLFCLKMVWLLRTFLILPEIQLIPAQTDAQALAKVRQLNSWIVVDRSGQEYYKFQALIYLFQVSPVGWIFVPIMNLVQGMGIRVYEIVASNRQKAGWLTQCLKFRPIYLSDSLPRKCLIGGCLILTLLTNIAGLQIEGVWNGLNLPHYLKWTIVATGLRQGWTMFAPVPQRADGWFVVVGKLTNDSEVNLLNPQLPVSWEKPPLVSALYRNERWREYYFDLRFVQNSDRTEMAAYAQYQCHQWNSTHQEKIESVKVDFMEELTMPNFQPFPMQTIPLIVKRC